MKVETIHPPCRTGWTCEAINRERLAAFRIDENPKFDNDYGKTTGYRGKPFDVLAMGEVPFCPRRGGRGQDHLSALSEKTAHHKMAEKYKGAIACSRIAPNGKHFTGGGIRRNAAYSALRAVSIKPIYMALRTPSEKSSHSSRSQFLIRLFTLSGQP